MSSYSSHTAPWAMLEQNIKNLIPTRKRWIDIIEECVVYVYDWEASPMHFCEDHLRSFSNEATDIYDLGRTTTTSTDLTLCGSLVSLGEQLAILLNSGW